jgi:hypothetical protein
MLTPQVSTQSIPLPPAAVAHRESHIWSYAGPGLLGDLVSDVALRQWAVDVYAELQRWDPYDGWRP